MIVFCAFVSVIYFSLFVNAQSSNNGLFAITPRRGSQCKTPGFNEDAECVSIRDCPRMLDGIRTGNTVLVEFARLSQCGYDTEPLVCCGTKLPNVNSPSTPQLTRQSDVTEGTVTETYRPQEVDNTLPDTDVCGKTTEIRILRGEITDIGEFPWTVMLKYKPKNASKRGGIRCGGSLINKRYVLTAAHCIVDKNFELTAAILKEWRLSTNPDCEENVLKPDCTKKFRLQVTKTIVHPSYNETTGSNDIGLLQLDRNVYYDDYLCPICIPPSDLPEPSMDTNLTLVGWGITETGNSSDVKLRTKVAVTSRSTCKEVFLRNLTSNQVCIKGIEGQEVFASFKGDSGGGVIKMYDETPQWYQEGVISYRDGKYPVIYTRVAGYRNWILQQIQKAR